jgi:hypothetical protein
MTRRWASLAALAAAGCVSFDPAGPPVRDISGAYTATIVTGTLRNTGYRGQVTGTYRLASGEAGPFGVALDTEDTLVVTDFGLPPKPIAGVTAIRNLYSWCDFTRLGIGPIPGVFRNDSLIATGQGSVPCFYRLGGGFLLNVHTEVFLTVVAAR